MKSHNQQNTVCLCNVYNTQVVQGLPDDKRQTIGSPYLCGVLSFVIVYMIGDDTLLPSL